MKGKRMEYEGHHLRYQSDCEGCFFDGKESCPDCDMGIWIEENPSPWHTGTPTEEGWYLLHYPECKEQPYELAQWNGEHFVAVKPFHAIIVRIEASSVPYWQKIEEN